MIFKKIKINKKWLILSGLIILGCFGLNKISLATDSLSALSTGAGFLGSVILKGANAVLYGILKLTFIALAAAMWLLDVMISPTMFENVFFSSEAKAGINTGWSFVRDFFNLFFILVIVLIGLSTILGVSKFKDKATLFRVVSAALLINFSMPITLFVIDASQIFMQFFADAIIQMKFGAKIQALINFASIMGGTGLDLKDNFTFFVIIVTVIVMTVIMTVMIFYLAISLIVRMIALWVLIILSPVAMFGYAMEGTKLSNMRDEWTKSLMNWCFYGPVLLFFLWLAIILVDAMSKASAEGIGNFSSQSSNQVSTNMKGLSGFIVSFCGIIIPYITAVYLLFYGYDKAKRISEGAATKILGAGNKKFDEWGNKAKGYGYSAARQLTLPGTREAIGEGVKEKVENYEGSGKWIARRLTKDGRKDLQTERNAKWKERIGGDGGAAARKYKRSKAQEKLNEWKENPISDAEMDVKFKEGDLAATIHKSQNNQIKDGTSYNQAMKNLEGHIGLQDTLKRETKKENMGAFLESEIEREGFDRNTPEGLEAIKTLYGKELGKKTNRDLFINQNEKLFLDENGKDGLNQEILDYLYERSKNIEQKDRAKMAEGWAFKNPEVRNKLASNDKGRFILGIEENPKNNKTKRRAGFV